MGALFEFKLSVDLLLEQEMNSNMKMKCYVVLRILSLVGRTDEILNVMKNYIEGNTGIVEVNVAKNYGDKPCTNRPFTALTDNFFLSNYVIVSELCSFLKICIRLILKNETHKKICILSRILYSVL